MRAENSSLQNPGSSGRARGLNREQAGFFTKLREKYGEMDGILKLIASHPGLDGRAERAAAADLIGDDTYEPVLSDQDWVALRGICQGGLPTVRRGGRKK